MTDGIDDWTDGSPTAVLKRALWLRDRLRYREVVSLCDPASVQAWFAEYRAGTRPRNRTELRREFPRLSEEALDRAVAYELEQAGKLGMPGTSTDAEVLALTPEEFAFRWFEHDDVRCQIIRELRARGAPAPDWRLSDVTYDTTVPEPTAENEVRIGYWRQIVAGTEVTPDDLDFETLRRTVTGEWRLVARLGLLQPDARGTIIPHEYAYLFDR